MGFGQAPDPQGGRERETRAEIQQAGPERGHRGPLVSPSGVSHVPRGAAPLHVCPLSPGSGGEERPVASFPFPQRMGNL